MCRTPHSVPVGHTRLYTSISPTEAWPSLGVFTTPEVA